MSYIKAQLITIAMVTKKLQRAYKSSHMRI